MLDQRVQRALDNGVSYVDCADQGQLFAVFAVLRSCKFPGPFGLVGHVELQFVASQCRACPCNVYGVAVRFAYGQLKPLVWVLIGRVFCSGNFLDVVEFSFVIAGTCWQWCLVGGASEGTGIFPVDICKLTATNLVAG